jgi:mRNA interferase MazF
MPSRYVPDRGDLVWIDFDPQAGHEPAGRRPAIVLSPAYYNRSAGLALLCPVTSRVKNYPFEVRIPEGQPVVGAALADQFKSLDWEIRRAEFIGTLPAAVTESILAKSRSLLSPRR